MRGFYTPTTASAPENKECLGYFDIVFRYDQTSAQVKGLENQATRLSSEAREENILTNNMQKKITILEQEIPSALKVMAQEFTP